MKLLLTGTRQMLQNVLAYLETCYPTTTTSCAKKKKRLRFQIIFLTVKFIPKMF